MAKKPVASPTRTAVVLIHGIGNQPPMDTLRGFVDAVWWRDPRVAASKSRKLWVKPSDQFGDYELRRMTASTGSAGDRTDFFEFYWAHMMEGTRSASVFWWLQRLFCRRLERIPGNAFVPWLAIGCAAVLALAATVLFAVVVLGAIYVLVHCEQNGLLFALGLIGCAATIAAGAWALRYRVLVQVVGDAARYLTPDPENIAARSRIRGAGVELLKRLQNDPRYDRVVLVGHSLGTVVGYDVLSILWGEEVKALHQGNGAALKAINNVEIEAEHLWKLAHRPSSSNRLTKQEAEAQNKARQVELSTYRSNQRIYGETLTRGPELAWKITDFITLGSPLTYSNFLLVDDGGTVHEPDKARSAASIIREWQKKQLSDRDFSISRIFAARVAERTFPSSPPQPDEPGSATFCYKSNEFEKPQLLPHHATVFAATRWTNIYAAPKALLFGDVISGPISPLFGPGVLDVRLTGKMSKTFVAHVHYWDADRFGSDVEHLDVLRRTLDLPI